MPSETLARLEIQVVEKQSLNHNTSEMLKEAQIMQALTQKYSCHNRCATSRGAHLLNYRVQRGMRHICNNK